MVDYIATGPITYQTLGDDIHFIRFEESSRQAVTALMTLIEQLYIETADAGVLYLIVDSSAGSLPMAAAIRDGMQLENRYPKHPKVILALLHSHPMAKLLDGMLRPLRNKNQIRLFGPHDRDQATEWLRTRQAEAELAKRSVEVSR
jgi:hypothetical protein